MSIKSFHNDLGCYLLAAGVLASAVFAGAAFAGAAFAQTPAAKSGKALAREQPFLTKNEAAMEKMMAGMAIKPSGDIDADFVDMMVPHHQGAIDMAALELRYGSNQRLKAIAQEIVVTQQQEIAAMRLAVGEPLPPSHASPVSPGDTNTSSTDTGA